MRKTFAVAITVAIAPPRLDKHRYEAGSIALSPQPHAVVAKQPCTVRAIDDALRAVPEKDEGRGAPNRHRKIRALVKGRDLYLGLR
ncbi:MAG: hypothetical protein N2653_14080 [Burkholderiales bacterium]|nr:hypothetical protein [Burkholderiales bacterium]